MGAIVALIMAVFMSLVTGLAPILEIFTLIGTFFGSILITIGGAFTSLTGVIAQLVNFLNPWFILIDAIGGLICVIDSMCELITSLLS